MVAAVHEAGCKAEEEGEPDAELGDVGGVELAERLQGRGREGW